jgi:hypothetical protein
MSAIEIGAPASLAEINAKVPKKSIGAAELKEQRREKAAKKPFIARQRATARAKGSDDIHAVDRDAGTGRAQDAGSVHIVDRGPKKTWQRAYSLPSFPDPPGYTYCWIARHRRRHGDDANLLASIREGWEFVKPGELDEEDVPTETFTGRLAKHGEVVGDETTILMKMPDELKAQRDAYYNRRRDAATREVRKPRPGIAEANSKMPLVEDRNEISEESVQMRARRAPKRDDSDT